MNESDVEREIDCRKDPRVISVEGSHNENTKDVAGKGDERPKNFSKQKEVEKI